MEVMRGEESCVRFSLLVTICIVGRDSLAIGEQSGPYVGTCLEALAGLLSTAYASTAMSATAAIASGSAGNSGMPEELVVDDV